MTVPAAFDLTGRVALVTGAGSPEGIGLATARLLGELGAAVAVTATTLRARERAHELEKSGVLSLGLVADLTDEAEVRRVVADVTDVLGAPTVLVNNAGMTSVAAPTLSRDIPGGRSGPSGPDAPGGAESGTITDLSPEQWRSVAEPQPRHGLPHHARGAPGHDRRRMGSGGDGDVGDRFGDGHAG
jgi:3-oxoacyl-[acyl-carrier protein] reductase